MKSIKITDIIEVVDKIKKLSNPDGFEIRIYKYFGCPYRVVYHGINNIYCAVGSFMYLDEVINFLDEIYLSETAKMEDAII